ncbi:N-acetylglutamate synthase-like GNAT family acetyltransferase [Bacilli bacterium PM5-3]|nr:N-acetylglutamate synthase-like GNAT family acetyltransferase [Bacilli bacterium PM5-3]MDH6603015.1 N-acetylglutamate synthase-like GNAT family acetyltransferase [Bacilli bacterium PM5-9]
MELSIREICDEDKERCLWIEKYALPEVIYVNDVWDYFTSRKDGRFLGVFKDNELGGFGKITRLFENVGWLETLRIHPDYQTQGLGNEMYKGYMEAAKELGLTKIGMFTEFDNYRSENLAKKYGFSKVGDFVDYTKEIENENDNYNGSFKLIDEIDADKILAAHYSKMNSYLIINKTFFPAIDGLANELARRKWAYIDDNGNIVIVGYRMQPHKALFLAYYYGNLDEILSFVNHLGIKLGSKRIAAIRDKSDLDIKNELYNHGFNDGEEIISMWK